MQWEIIGMNFIYAVVGGMITLIFMAVGYRVLDRMTAFDTCEELNKGNQAVGSVVQGMFIGIGVAIGLVIGMGLN